MRESGIDAFNGAQGRILYVLWEFEPLSITQVGKYTALANTTLTSMLDRMARQGLIRREPDPHSRRRTLITLTPQARAMRGDYERISDDVNDTFYKGFSPEEIQDFEAMLRRIITNFEGGMQDES